MDYNYVYRLMAQAVFFLKRGQTDRQTNKRGWTPCFTRTTIANTETTARLAEILTVTSLFGTDVCIESLRI